MQSTAPSILSIDHIGIRVTNAEASRAFMPSSASVKPNTLQMTKLTKWKRLAAYVLI